MAVAEDKSPVSPETDRLSAPKCTTNNLSDIITWLKLGDIVCLHVNRKEGVFYHICDGKADLEKIRIIAVDVAKMPSLLNEDKWPWYIQQQGGKVCKCPDMESVFSTTKYAYNYKI